MKKIFALFLALLTLAPHAFAAEFSTSNATTFSLNQTRDIFPMTITATAEGEITAEKGIQILFDTEKKILWDAVSSLSATGSAVTNGKMLASPVPVYKNDYKILYIPVTADFAAGESVTLTGIRLRAYKNAFRESYLRLDTNADGIADKLDINKIEIVDIVATDFTPPYPVTDVSAVANSAFTQVALSWHPAPDYDLLGVNLERKRVRNGFTQEAALLTNSIVTTFTDTDVMPGDVLTYTFTNSDGRNFSEPVVKTITLKASSPEIPAQPAPTADEALKAYLESHYGYYKLRYQIKCNPADRTVSEGDAACLWAKIDLVYAQSLLARYDLSVALSARDLELIALRLPFSQNRYQTQCIEATEPATYCTALGKALDRAEYLIGE